MRAICINLINLTTIITIVVSGGKDDDNEDEYEDGNEMSALCKVVAKCKREKYFLIFLNFPSAPRNYGFLELTRFTLFIHCQAYTLHSLYFDSGCYLC